MFLSIRPARIAAGFFFGCCYLSFATGPAVLAQGNAQRPAGQPSGAQGRPAGARPATGGQPKNTGAPVNRPVANVPSGGAQIALIDISRVFKNHPGFNQRLEAVKADLAAFEKDMVAKRNKITSEQQRLADFAVGSPDYKKADASITQQVSDMQVTAQLKKKDLLLEEARIYYGAYNEVLSEVEQVASRYGINLVLRFDSTPIDVLDRNSVLQGVNRPVVHQKGLDITDLVLESLNARYAPKVSARPGP